MLFDSGHQTNQALYLGNHGTSDQGKIAKTLGLYDLVKWFRTSEGKLPEFKARQKKMTAQLLARLQRKPLREVSQSPKMKLLKIRFMRSPLCQELGCDQPTARLTVDGKNFCMKHWKHSLYLKKKLRWQTDPEFRAKMNQEQKIRPSYLKRLKNISVKKNPVIQLVKEQPSDVHTVFDAVIGLLNSLRKGIGAPALTQSEIVNLTTVPENSW